MLLEARRVASALVRGSLRDGASLAALRLARAPPRALSAAAAAPRARSGGKRMTEADRLALEAFSDGMLTPTVAQALSPPEAAPPDGSAVVASVKRARLE